MKGFPVVNSVILSSINLSFWRLFIYLLEVPAAVIENYLLPCEDCRSPCRRGAKRPGTR